MGPDCGTAVVGGLGLGFANVVSPGPVGIVAASGTGCQQVLALLDHAGVGVASALGVGGRDLSAEVRGLATREALRRLDEDPAVELIVLVSKPPARRRRRRDPGVRRRAGHPGRAGAARAPASPTSPQATEAVLPPAAAARCPTWPVVGAAASAAGGRLPPRAVRRRHAGQRGEDRSPRRRSVGVGARGTRSSTSATTPTPPAGRTR